MSSPVLCPGWLAASSPVVSEFLPAISRFPFFKFWAWLSSGITIFLSVKSFRIFKENFI